MRGLRIRGLEPPLSPVADDGQPAVLRLAHKAAQKCGRFAFIRQQIQAGIASAAAGIWGR